MIAREKPHERRKEGKRDEITDERPRRQIRLRKPMTKFGR